MDKMYRILVVEDEIRILRGVKNAILCNIDKIEDVIIAQNGKTALDKVEQYNPDIIITDIRMPEVDGMQLIKAVRAKGYDMSIIVLTAMEDFKCIQQLIQYDLQNYIVKPFSIEEIINEVNEAIDKVKQKQELNKIKKIANIHPDLIEKMEEASGNKLIIQAIAYIEKNINNPISLKETAEELHVSRPYLSTLFKKEMHKTFSSYLTGKKLLFSKKMLVETDMHIYEIAELTGYQSDKYFIQVFKKKFGITPQAFREKFLENK